MVNVAFQQRVTVQHCSCSILFRHFLVFHPMHTMIWLWLLRPCKDISQMYHLLWALNLLPTPISVSLVLIHGGKPLICLKTVLSTYWILPLSVETSLCQLGHVKLLPHRYQILQGCGYRGPTSTNPTGADHAMIYGQFPSLLGPNAALSVLHRWCAVMVHVVMPSFMSNLANLNLTFGLPTVTYCIINIVPNTKTHFTIQASRDRRG